MGNNPSEKHRAQLKLLRKQAKKIKKLTVESDNNQVVNDLSDLSRIMIEEVNVNGKKGLVQKIMLRQGRYKIGWVCDLDAPCCMRCGDAFSFFFRRHHCRLCGYVVCTHCSDVRLDIDMIEEVGGSRICSHCTQRQSLPAYVIPKGQKRVPSRSTLAYRKREKDKRTTSNQSQSSTCQHSAIDRDVAKLTRSNTATLTRSSIPVDISSHRMSHSEHTPYHIPLHANSGIPEGVEEDEFTIGGSSIPQPYKTNSTTIRPSFLKPLQKEYDNTTAPLDSISPIYSTVSSPKGSKTVPAEVVVDPTEYSYDDYDYGTSPLCYDDLVVPVDGARAVTPTQVLYTTNSVVPPETSIFTTLSSASTPCNASSTSASMMRRSNKQLDLIQ